MRLSESGFVDLGRLPGGSNVVLLWFSWFNVLLAVVTMLTVNIQMNRDRIISMLQGTRPGELNWNANFVAKLLIYALIPILSLLGAQFPGALGQLTSWLSSVGGRH